MEPWLGGGEALSPGSRGILIVCRLQQPPPFPGSPGYPQLCLTAPSLVLEPWALSAFSGAASGREEAAGPLPEAPARVTSTSCGSDQAAGGLLCLSVRRHSLWGR